MAAVSAGSSQAKRSSAGRYCRTIGICLIRRARDNGDVSAPNRLSSTALLHSGAGRATRCQSGLTLDAPTYARFQASC